MNVFSVNSRRIGKLGLIVLAIIAVISYWLPALIFLMDRTGLDVVHSREAIGLRLKVGDGWFPLYSGATTMGRFMPMPDPKTVVFCKINWFSPWGCKQAWVYRHTFKAESLQSDHVLTTVKRYSWGAVGIVRDDVTQTPGRKLAIILDHGVAVSANDLDMLDSIHAVTN